MSHFYGSLDGSARTQATRQGTTRSGILGDIRGWDSGIRVYGYRSEPTHEMGERDCFVVSFTRGSHASGPAELIGTYYLDDEGNMAKLGQEPKEGETLVGGWNGY